MTWHVYALIDPRTDEQFYVGCTVDPVGRLAGHNYDPASSAWPSCVDVRKSGQRVRMSILAMFSERLPALLLEAQLILDDPKLVNRQRLPVESVQQIWRDQEEYKQKCLFSLITH